jgi:hypothetical protein
MTVRRSEQTERAMEETATGQHAACHTESGIIIEGDRHREWEGGCLVDEGTCEWCGDPLVSLSGHIECASALQDLREAETEIEVELRSR